MDYVIVDKVLNRYAFHVAGKKQNTVHQTGGYNLRNKKNKNKCEGNDLKQSQEQRDTNQ